MNSPATASSSVAPLLRSRTTRGGTVPRLSPRPPRCSGGRQVAHRSTCSTRYSDALCANGSAHDQSDRRAYRARCAAAWTAELAPPTIATDHPRGPGPPLRHIRRTRRDRSAGRRSGCRRADRPRQWPASRSAVAAEPSSSTTTLRSPCRPMLVALRPIRADRAEHHRLVHARLKQLGAGHASREAQVVPDHRTGARLAEPGLDHDHAQPFGRGVHGGREPRRPEAEDRHVVGR